jgi:hypothetical protein
LSSSCGQFGQANNSPQEINDIRVAIEVQEAETGVDKRFILATILQDSSGCVRAPTTPGEVPNPGLMQTYHGPGAFHEVNPCPSSMIHQMVKEGTAGTTAGGPGLVGCIHAAGSSRATAVYRASRIYNTGHYDEGENLGNTLYGTACYASDIANRLTGLGLELHALQSSKRNPLRVRGEERGNF